MLTYARTEDFVAIKEIGISESSAVSAYEQIRRYLFSATRFIERYTRRKFYPYIEERSYTIPAEFFDYRMRSLPARDIWLDQDLLEVVSAEIGQGTSKTAITEGDFYELYPWNLSPKLGVRLLWPNTWAGTWASVVGQWRTPFVFITGAWGYHDDYSNAWIDTNTTCPALDATQTTIVVPESAGNDAQGFPDLQSDVLIKIDDEYMEVTDVTSRTMTVVRGVRGSTAATHTLGQAIYKWWVVNEIQQACLMIAKTWREHDQATGGRQGVSEMSVGVELNIPNDAKNILMAYTKSTLGRSYV